MTKIFLDLKDFTDIIKLSLEYEHIFDLYIIQYTTKCKYHTFTMINIIKIYEL
jgi:hypothetical protein